MTISDVLSRAADAIQERGHCKGNFVDAAGNLCVAGALYLAAGLPVVGIAKPRDGWDAAKSYADADEAAAAFRRYVGSSVYTWNDQPERTKEEVVAALRAAAEQHRQQGD